MLQPFTATGGARIGWTNATWPLARLSARDDRLTISVWLLGEYSFTPDEVSAVERYTMIPVLGWGIRVRHCRTDCPERIIFWYLGTPDSLLDGIRAAGFLPTAPGAAVPCSRGFAIRGSVIVVAVALWNILLLADFARSGFAPPRPGPLTLVALLLAFVLSAGTLVSQRLQQVVLKPGRSVGEIQPLLRLIALISAIMLVVFSMVIANGGFQ
jgi:hypothetical protein